MCLRITVLSLCVAGALALTGCSAQPRPASAAPSPSAAPRLGSVPAAPRPYGPHLTILAASSSGAVVADPATASYRGYTSAGDLVWVDREAYRRDAEVTCAARCPDAVVSTFDEEGRPGPAWLRSGGRARPLALSGSPVRLVLTMRGPSDAVIAEGGRHDGDRIRVDRTDGTRLRVEVPSAAHVLWVEDLARTVALAVYGRPDGSGGTVLRFGRDSHGWRPVGHGVPVDGVWGGCVAGEGEPAVLAGPKATLLAREGPVPLRTDLQQVGECTAGRHGAVLLSRRLDGRGTPHTAMRGVDPAGHQVWARDLPAELEVAADPSGRNFALVGDGAMEIVGQDGQTISRRAGVDSALYTESGGLVVANRTGVLEWLKG
jgi:hypothetical protein